MTRRVLLGSLSLTLFVLVVLEVPLGFTFANHERDVLISEVEREAFALASIAEDSLERGDTSNLVGLADSYQQRDSGRVVIVDATGKAVVDSDPPVPGDRSFASRPEIGIALDGAVATGTRYSQTLHERFVYVAVPVASGGVVHGAVRITYPTATVDARVRRNWYILGGLAAVTLLAATIVGIGVARSVVAPLRRLEESTAALGAGDLAARAPAESGPSEVRALGLAFNRMAQRLEDLVTAQDQFVADASHQLRTPLTALRLRLENLEGDVPPARRATLDAALAELARFSRLIDGLLALARVDRAGGGPATAPVDVARVLDERRVTWADVAAEARVQVVTAPAADGRRRLMVLANADHLVQVLDNLLANAVDASEPGMTITLGARRAGGNAVELHVTDEGRGLTEDERRRAFDRFWTSGSGQDRLGGSGLGLAIVHKLVRAGGGEVELREAPGGGVDAVVTLPAATGPVPGGAR